MPSGWRRSATPGRTWRSSTSATGRSRSASRSKTAAAPTAKFSLLRDLVAVLDHFDVARAAFVGCSQGGATSLGLTLAQPERVSALVLLCPAWKRWGTITAVKPGTVIIHSEADDVIPIADSRELLRNSGLPESAPVVVGIDHRLADPEPLKAMLEACVRAVLQEKAGERKG